MKIVKVAFCFTQDESTYRLSKQIACALGSSLHRVSSSLVYRDGTGVR